MTEQERVQYIKENKRFPKEFWDYLDYIQFGLPIISIAAGFGMIYIWMYRNPILPVALGSCYSITLGFLLMIRVYIGFNKNSIFEQFPVKSKEDLENLAKRIKENFGVENVTVNKNLGEIKISIRQGWFSPWEDVTLIQDGDYMLVNSTQIGGKGYVAIIRTQKSINKLKVLLLE